MYLTDIAVTNGRAVQGRALAIKEDLSAYRMAPTHASFPNFCSEDVLNPS
jgi:hypothetical protein